MRISNSMMANNVKAYLFEHTEKLLKIQEKLASGRRINRPSDDPLGIGQMLKYRKSISSLEQYNSNITDAKLHIENVESVISAVTDLLTKAKQIASDIQPDMRSILANEVATLRDQVLNMANAKNKGNYVFGGDITDNPPFDNAGVYSGDNGSKEYMIGENLQIGLNADGSEIFQGAADVFTVLDDLETALNADDSVAVKNQLSPLIDIIENMNTIRAVNAGHFRRLESTESHYEHFQLNIENLLASVEETNMAEAIVDLKVQQTAYESTLNTASQIITPSLVDFIK